MFEPLTALVLLALMVLAPAGVFLVFRPRLRRVAAERMTRDGRAGVVGLAVAAFVVVQLLAVAVAGAGAFSVAYPASLDLGLVRKVEVDLLSDPTGFASVNGRPLGWTPVRARLAVGKHNFRLDSVPGRQTLDTTHSLSSNLSLTFRTDSRPGAEARNADVNLQRAHTAQSASVVNPVRASGSTASVSPEQTTTEYFRANSDGQPELAYALFTADYRSRRSLTWYSTQVFSQDIKYTIISMRTVERGPEWATVRVTHDIRNTKTRKSVRATVDVRTVTEGGHWRIASIRETK